MQQKNLKKKKENFKNLLVHYLKLNFFETAHYQTEPPQYMGEHIWLFYHMFKMDLICLMAIKKKKEKIQQRDFVKLFKKKKKN